MLWGLIFPTVIFIGYWIAPSKSTIISTSVKVCWTAVEWYTILEIRSSMFIDKINRLFRTKPLVITEPVGLIDPVGLTDPIDQNKPCYTDTTSAIE